MSLEPEPLRADEIAALIFRIVDLSVVVEPMVMAHLEQLRMDTDEDNALLDDIHRPMRGWAEAVRRFRAQREGAQRIREYPE